MLKYNFADVIFARFYMALTKICKRCGLAKPFECFVKDKKQADGLNTWCKDCVKVYRDSYYAKNKEELNARRREKYKESPEIYRERSKIWANAHREYRNEYEREYREKNRRKVLDRMNKRINYRRKTDIQLQIRMKIQKNLWHFATDGTRRGFALDRLGCSVDEFRRHIERLFKDGMSWDNYGRYGKWTFDHIIPLTAFDLTEEEQLLKACHYTNIQPLNPIENIRKGGASRMKKNGYL